MQSWFVSHRKKLEEVDFVDADFMHKKINKNSVYVWIMVWKIFQKMHVAKTVWVKRYEDLKVLN